MSSWLGWLVLACAPALLLLVIDRLDLRRPESQDFVDARAMHRDLVQRFQRDAYFQLEAQAVIARLERVPASSRSYAEAQDLLRRYRWEAERASETEPPVPPTIVVEQTPRTWQPAAPPGVDASGEPNPPASEPTSVTAPIDSDAVIPTLPAGDEESSGWTSMAPAKPRDAAQPTPPAAARGRIDSDIAARIGFRCYTANFGIPTAREGARFEIRLGNEPIVRIGGLRLRNLRDLREGLHRLVASDAALDPLDDYLAAFSEDALVRSALEPAAASHWVWVDTERAPVFVDLLAEAARCQGRSGRPGPENPAGFATGLTAGDSPAVVALPVERAADQTLEVRWPRSPAGAALEVVLRVDGRPHPIARFELPPAGPVASR